MKLFSTPNGGDFADMDFVDLFSDEVEEVVEETVEEVGEEGLELEDGVVEKARLKVLHQINKKAKV